MKLVYPYIIIISIITFLVGCTDPPDYPDEPVIEYISMSRSFMQQSNIDADSMTVRFSFTDGDGNLGSSPLDDFFDVFVTDTRDGFLAGQYRIPFIPEQGVGNGISGEIALRVYSTCCITDVFPACFVTPSIPTDTVIYEIQIMDRDSNMSNIIQTEPLVLGCD